MECLQKSQLRFFHNPISRTIWQYVFPIQFVLGLLGNSLNLWVLASDEVPNIASDMLAAVSFCDLAFLLVMFPNCLAAFDFFAYDNSFRYFHVNTNQHMSAVANWMSAAAIWLILAVSIERYLIVRSPFRAKLYWQRGKMVVVLSSIFVTTGLLTVYHHFEYDCAIDVFCNGTQFVQFCKPSGRIHRKAYWSRDIVTPTYVKKVYLNVSTFFNAILVVFVPIVLVILLNILMIRQLKINWTSPRLESMRGTMNRSQIRQRQRVTITVIAIGLCFSLSQGPSAFMVLYELFHDYKVSSTFYTIYSITNSLVVTGKTINFILFCLSSEHFRRKCFVVIYRKFPKLSQSSIGKRILDHQRSNSCDRSSSLRTVRSRRGSATTLPGRDVGTPLVEEPLSCAKCSIENSRSLSASRQNLPYRTRLHSTMSQEPEDPTISISST